MVQQTLEPGVSVAQANGVNPNPLFLWRRRYCEGRLTAQDASPMRLLPVTVMDAPPLDRSGGVSLGLTLWNARWIDHESRRLRVWHSVSRGRHHGPRLRRV